MIVRQALISSILVFFWSNILFAQTKKVVTYYDDQLRSKKEVYYVLDAQPQVLDGSYIGFYSNGQTKEIGAFRNGEAVGVWEYFYENGQPKMSGSIEDNLNHGLWKYYFESGKISMEGSLIKGRQQDLWVYYYENGVSKSRGSYKAGKKVGLWNNYYENGNIKSQIYFEGIRGDYKEFYNSGPVKAEGIKIEDKIDSTWIYYYENGSVQAQGNYEDGVKTGPWKFFHPNGKLSAEGAYLNGLTEGEWIYYNDDGGISSRGVEKEGKKDGYWQLFYNGGALKGKGIFKYGAGEYKEYYESGAIKTVGLVENGINQGLWKYYYEDGILEGESNFVDGSGSYKGYYKDGSLKMEGIIENGAKTGIWKLYHNDGSLAGYYKTIYEDDKPVFRIMEEKDSVESPLDYEKPEYLFKKQKIRYFRPQINEFKGIIIGTNPVAMIAGSIPFTVEYYLQERLGYELQYAIIRDPFFTSDANVELNKDYLRGYSIGLKQKFYSKDRKLGMPYFAQEFRFTTVDHFSNINDSLNIVNSSVVGASEKRYEYAITGGYRFMKDAGDTGITIDVFAGLGVGYRDFSKGYPELEIFENIFHDVKKSKLSVPVRFGVHIGYSFKGR